LGFEKASDFKFPIENLVIFTSGNMAMITHIVKVFASQEAFVVQVVQGWLDIEGVDSSETDQTRISFDKIVRSFYIFL